MTCKEKALSQLLQLSEENAEELSSDISMKYGVLPDREVLEEYESLPSGLWVGLYLVGAAVIVVAIFVCSMLGVV